MNYSEACNLATHAFYSPTLYNGTIIDFVHPQTGKSIIGGHDLNHMREKHGPDTVLLEAEEALQRAEKARRNKYVSPPSEITKEEFIYFLEVLPPIGWVNTGSHESFKMSERTCGTLTGIYARIGEKYFAMCDECTMTHQQIIEACKATE